MKFKHLRQTAAGLLAALLLLQGSVLPAHAAGWSSWFSRPTQQTAAPQTAGETQAVQLQNGTAVIPSDADAAAVKQALFDALVANKEALGETFDPQSLEWEFYGTSASDPWSLWDESNWVSVLKGGTWTNKYGLITYKYSVGPLINHENGNYKVRLASDKGEGVTLTKTAGVASSIQVAGNKTVNLTYNTDGSIDYDALRAAIFEDVVTATTPQMTVENVTIQYKYGEEPISHDPKWGNLEGYKGGFMGAGAYDAVGKGSYTLLISYNGGNVDGTYYLPTSTQVNVTFAAVRETPDITLNEGCTVSLNDGNWDAVRQEILDKVVVENSYDLTVENTRIEYFYEGLTSATDAWVPLEGKEIALGQGYPAVQDNQSYKIHVIFNGSAQYTSATSNEVTVRFASKQDSSITLKPLQEGASYTTALPYNVDTTVNYDTLRENIFNAVVDSTAPEGLAWNAEGMTYLATYKLFDTNSTIATNDIGTKWVPLEGEKVMAGSVQVGQYPAISEGEQKIKISWLGNDAYYGFEQEVTVTIAERPEAPYELKETPDAVTLTVKEDLSVDYSALKTAIFNAVVASSEVIKAEDVTIEYYYNGITELDSKWLPLEGQAVVGSVGYPAISAGEQKIRISWPGNQQYAPTTIEKTITVKDREQVQFNLHEGPYEVGMKFTDDQAYDYTVTAQAIYNAVVASTTPNVDFSAVTLEFSKTGANYEPLDQTNFWASFGVGKWKIKISVADSQAYRGNSVVVDVEMVDARTPSSVELHTGVSFTYNMDPNVMKQAIFDNVIDWTNSILPEKAALDLDDFVIEYKAKLTDAETGLNADLGGLLDKFPGLGDLISSDALTQWVPLEGKVYEVMGQVLGKFPAIGAGENQQIRISYKGNAEFRPSETTEGTVTVNKAKVSVKVHSTNIYVDEALPAGFITTDPADKFDLYTVYAGITSNVTTGLYLDLPARYTENSLLLKAIDGVLEGLGQKTLTQMMNDGVTVGELRNLFNTQGVLDALKALGINTGTFGQILEVINKLPGILDSVRISFGEPNRAGLYTVAAITDNKNYETGVGIGFLLVKMRLSGSKLTWNSDIPGGKLTAEQAKDFDFGATLSYNGDVTVNQSGVKYLYSGFTSKWRPYSSTTTPPTEPGRYVVTVCIIGGDYLAAPITRSFQITK